MKKLIFILLLSSCSKIEQPKGNLDLTRDIYISTTLFISERAYDLAYLNPLYTTANCEIKLTKSGDKLVIDTRGMYYEKYDLTFAEGKDFVIRSKDKNYPIYDTIAYVPNMKMFLTKCNFYIEKGDYINLYKTFETELIAIPISH